MRLAQVVLFCDDVPRLRRFYEDVLGCAFLDGDDRFARLDACGVVVALHATPAAGPPSPPREDSYLKLCFHASDVAAERARLVAAGITMRAVVTFGDVVLCDGIDPEGNVFQITTR